MKEDNIIGEAGGIPGLVRIVCDSLGRPLRVEIDDLVFQKEDKGLVSDLFIAALNDMNDKLLARAREQIRNQRGKLSLAELLNAPVKKNPFGLFSSHNPPIPETDEDEDDNE